MGFKLVKGSLGIFQINGGIGVAVSEVPFFQELVFENTPTSSDEPAGIVSSITMQKNGTRADDPNPKFRIVIVIKDLKEEAFRSRFGRIQNIFRISYSLYINALTCEATINYYHSVQMGLFIEFLKKCANSEFLTWVTPLFPKPRDLTEQEITLQKMLPKLDAGSFSAAFKMAKEINKPNAESGINCDYRDALFLLGNACIEARLFNEACEAFRSILDSNYCYESAMYILGNLILEGFELSGDKHSLENHEKLLQHLIYFINATMALDANFEFSSLLFKIISVSGLGIENFPYFASSKKDFHGLKEIAIQLAELQFQLRQVAQKPVREISHLGALEIERFPALALPDLTKERWLLRTGDIEKFQSADSENNTENNTDKLVFVNEASSPYFAEIILRKQLIGIRMDFEIVLPRISENLATGSITTTNASSVASSSTAASSAIAIGVEDSEESEESEKDDWDLVCEQYEIHTIDHIFSLGYFPDERCYKLSLVYVKLGREELDELFGYLQNRIPAETLGVVRRCLTSEALSTKEQMFEGILNRLSVSSTCINEVLEYTKSLNSDEIKTEGVESYELYEQGLRFNHALLRAAKKYLALGLHNEAFRVLDLVDSRDSHGISYANYFLSKIKLREVAHSIGIDSREKTKEKLTAYVQWARAKDAQDEDLDLFIKLLKFHAGILPALAPQQKFSLEYNTRTIEANYMRFIEFTLELADGNYYLNASNGNNNSNNSNNNNNNNNYSSSAAVSSSSQAAMFMLSSEGKDAASSALSKAANESTNDDNLLKRVATMNQANLI